MIYTLVYFNSLQDGARTLFLTPSFPSLSIRLYFHFFAYKLMLSLRQTKRWSFINIFVVFLFQRLHKFFPVWLCHISRRQRDVLAAVEQNQIAVILQTFDSCKPFSPTSHKHYDFLLFHRAINKIVDILARRQVERHFVFSVVRETFYTENFLWNLASACFLQFSHAVFPPFIA